MKVDICKRIHFPIRILILSGATNAGSYRCGNGQRPFLDHGGFHTWYPQ